MRQSFFALLYVAAVVAGCDPANAPSIDLDGGPYFAACRGLADAGCPEGNDVFCEATVRKAAEARTSDQPLACWASVKTKEAARACGGVDCK